MGKYILLYKDYISDNTYTKKYMPPETAVIPQPGDKIINYIRTQFLSQTSCSMPHIINKK